MGGSKTKSGRALSGSDVIEANAKFSLESLEEVPDVELSFFVNPPIIPVSPSLYSSPRNPLPQQIDWNWN